MSANQPISPAAPQICRQCLGRCCQGHPGLWVEPVRFLSFFALPGPASPTELQDNLSKFGLTLRRINGISIPSPEPAAAGCGFLPTQGRALSKQLRPCQCLALVPVLDTLLDDRIHCSLPPHVSTLAALRNGRRFWRAARKHPLC